MTDSPPKYIPYTLVYTDSKGNSHFSDEQIALIPDSPGAQTEHSEGIGVDTITFLREPSDWVRAMGPPSSANFFILLNGRTETTTSDGETRTFSKGDLVMFTDTTGQGHSTKSIGKEQVLWAQISPTTNFPVQ